jgi:hypothetical protein
MYTSKSSAPALLGAFSAMVIALALSLLTLLLHPNPTMIELDKQLIPFDRVTISTVVIGALSGASCNAAVDELIGVEWIDCRLVPVTDLLEAAFNAPRMRYYFTALAAAGIIAFAMAMRSIDATTPKRELDRTVKGRRPVYDLDARNSLRSEITKTGRTAKGGLWIASHVQLTPTLESYNILGLGTQGSGKTSHFRALIEQFVGRGDRVFIHDVKGDMTAGLPGDDFILIAPHDARSWAYDIAADIRNHHHAYEFGKRMVDEDGDDRMWGKGGGSITGDLTWGLAKDQKGKWSWGELAHTLLVPGGEMKTRLEELGSINASRLIFGSQDPEENRTTMSLLITIWIAATTIILPLAQAWAQVPPSRRFSLRLWVNRKGKLPGTIILQRSSEYAYLSTALGGFLIDRLLGLAMSPDRNRNRGGKLVLCLDELPELGVITRLPNALNIGRELGLITIGGVQDIAHLVKIYGNELAQVLLARFRIKVIHQLDAGDTADRISALIGDRTVLRPSPSEFNAKTGKPVLVREKERVLDPYMFETALGVRNNSGTLVSRTLIMGLGNPAILDIPITGWPERRPGHAPAGWVDQLEPSAHMPSMPRQIEGYQEEAS